VSAWHSYDRDVAGSSVTIVERTAPWLPGVWHEYEFIGSSTDVGVLLAEIEDDPTSIFWG
jgi:Protein of unknown function (DUF3024)